MSIPVLILGESGTGKSTSMRNFTKSEIGLINVMNKPLPFRGQFDLIATKDITGVKQAVMSAKRNVVVIDDFGYTITDIYMRYSHGTEKLRDQYEVYKIIGAEVYNLITGIQMKDEPDQIVYMTMHTDVDASGHIIPATIGKMLNEKINLVGMFSVVLLSSTDGEKYQFVTNGVPPAKTPSGMFDSQYIDNDLKSVDAAIRDYWGMSPLVKNETEGKE